MPPKPGAPPPIVPAADGQQFSFSESHAASTVTRRDDSGEYALEREDGSATFIARPNGGTEQSWPVNTDAERAAVPNEFQEQLRIMSHPVSVPLFNDVQSFSSPNRRRRIRAELGEECFGKLPAHDILRAFGSSSSAPSASPPCAARNFALGFHLTSATDSEPPPIE
jgi:hypothetical protein